MICCPKLLRFAGVCALLASSCLLPSQLRAAGATLQENSLKAFPVSTTSVAARAAFDEGLVQWENHRFTEALKAWRKAVRDDANFALAHLYLSTITPDPVERTEELKKALALKPKASNDEQLVIDWLTETNENHLVSAITSMNELLVRYPKDAQLLYRAALWYRNLRQRQRAEAMFNRVLQLDAKFADAFNQLAYLYAYQGKFDQALDAMRQYVALLPHEPNPEDSYAEILQMSGRFEEAIVHYRAALAIDPKFVSSQAGIAATYSLMGDQKRAREEYGSAIQKAASLSSTLSLSEDVAVTYVRENKLAEATRTLQDVAKRAHEGQLATIESNAYRMMALYQSAGASAMDLLQKGEDALHQDHLISKAAFERQLAIILKTRACRASQDGDLKTAVAALKRLEELMKSTGNGYIEVAYHGAAGAVLLAQKNYGEAILELLEDDQSPLSLRMLATAYQKSGSAKEADSTRLHIANLHVASLEQALMLAESRPRP
jgi:tetratricopeptide (TPR) repeat protein